MIDLLRCSSTDEWVWRRQRPCLVAGLGGKIAFTSDRDGNEEIYADLSRTDLGRRTSDHQLRGGRQRRLVAGWDGRIAFTSDRNGSASVYVMDSDGARVPRLATGVPNRLPSTVDGSPSPATSRATRSTPRASMLVERAEEADPDPLQASGARRGRRQVVVNRRPERWESQTRSTVKPRSSRWRERPPDLAAV